MSNFEELFSFTVEEAMEATERLKENEEYRAWRECYESNQKVFKNENLMNMTLKQFWNEFSFIYKPMGKDSYNSIVIPVYGFIDYFNEGIDREMIYCSVFRNFALTNNGTWFNIVGLDNNRVIMYDDIEYKFNCRCDTKVGEMLDKLYNIVRQHHIDFLKTYDHCEDGEYIPMYVERRVMCEFILRNAEKYDIDYLKEDEDNLHVYGIGKKWI